MAHHRLGIDLERPVNDDDDEDEVSQRSMKCHQISRQNSAGVLQCSAGGILHIKKKRRRKNFEKQLQIFSICRSTDRRYSFERGASARNTPVDNNRIGGGKF
jgi:hypothetical protein